MKHENLKCENLTEQSLARYLDDHFRRHMEMAKDHPVWELSLQHSAAALALDSVRAHFGLPFMVDYTMDANAGTGRITELVTARPVKE